MRHIIPVSGGRDSSALDAAERELLDFSSWARRVLLREAGAMPGTTT